MNIKTEIKARREDCGWSRHRLSLRLGKAGDYIAKIEAGEWDPPLSVLRQLAQIFKASGNPFPPEIEMFLGVGNE